MSDINKLLRLVDDYICKNDLNVTPEELFIEFQTIVETHNKFEEYLKEKGLNNKLEQMKRNDRLKEKRKLFANWYSLVNQGDQFYKETLINLSEMTFITTRSVRRELSKDTIA